jgi:hypothetical protein
LQRKTKIEALGIFQKPNLQEYANEYVCAKYVILAYEAQVQIQTKS